MSNKACVPNKKEDLNLNLFSKAKEISLSKTLTMPISCECKYRFDGTKFNSDQWCNK